MASVFGDGGYSARMQAPAINSPSGKAFLSFSYEFSALSSGIPAWLATPLKVLAKTDGDLTWTTVWTVDNGSEHALSWPSVRIDLSSFASRGTLLIAFDSNFGQCFAAVDEVVVTEN
jgi:hypothetical protein